MARALADQLGARFIRRQAGDLASRKAFDALRRDPGGPAVLFIEGLDAPDHAVKTVDALLASMEALAGDTILVIISARRPDMLDPALMREDRFAVKIPVGLPDLKERLALLKARLHGAPLAGDVDLAAVAKSTPGLAPEELGRIASDAEALATRRGAEKIAMGDFRDAIDRFSREHERVVVMGGTERFISAYHEAGHAVVSHLLPHVSPMRKVTIIPHGLNALGLFQVSAEQSHGILSRRALLEKMALALAGRVAEELAVAEARPQTEDDLESARRIARHVVMRLADKKRKIEQEVQSLVEEAAALAKKILCAHRHELDAVAASLLDHETLDRAEVERLLPAPGRRPSPNER